MSFNRAEAAAGEINKMALSLDRFYHRGNREGRLTGRSKTYRYLIFKRTSKAAVKIVYYVDEKDKTVYVTDFFPTEKDPSKIIKRNR
jgi:hypothetical protein